MKQHLQQSSRCAGKWRTWIWLLCGLLGSSGLAYGQNVTVTGADATTNAGSPYLTLGAAFASINLASQTGNVIVIGIINNTNETTAVLNQSVGAWTSLTISPTGGLTRTISSSTAGHLIDLNGADNVTIDGLNTGGDALIISNTATGTSSAVRFIADATANVIRNCTLQGSGTLASGGVVSFSTGTTTGNDNNNINNCNITGAGANLPINGIASDATSGAINNSGNILNANNISDYFNATSVSVGIKLTAGGGADSNTGWTITNNRLFQTANRTYTAANTHNGIQILTGSGYTLTGNVIGFANSAGTGTTNMIGVNTLVLGGTFPSSYTITSGTSIATRYIAMSCAFTAAGVVSEIQGNTIGGFALLTSSGATTTNGIWCGINVTSGNANVGTTTGNTIGATTGNGSIYTATTTTGGTSVGIYVTSANTVSIQNNTIGAIDAVGTTAALSGGFTGIDVAGVGSYTISSNTIGNATTDNIRTGHLLNSPNLTNTTGTLTSTTGATSTMVGIRSAITGTTLSISSNTLRGWATSGTVIAVTGITNTGAVVTTNTINTNALGTAGLGWIRYAVANSGALRGISNFGGAGTCALSIQTNDIIGITHSVAGTSTHTYITNSATTLSQNISSNTFTNLNVNTTASVTFISNSVTVSATGSQTINSNSIATAFNKTGAGGTIILCTSSAGSTSGASITHSTNNFSNITVTGATTIAGWISTDGGTANKNYTNNTFSNWTGGSSAITAMSCSFGGGAGGNGNVLSGNTISTITGSGSITGINIGGSGTTSSVFSNTINGLSTTGASLVVGITSAAPTSCNIYKNKIYDLQANNASGTVTGIAVTAGTLHNIYNNLIGNLTASASASVDAIRGIGITSTTVSSTQNIYHNTIFLNATSSGANFGTSGIFHTFSTTATTSALNLRNNIIVNTSTPNGTGLTVAFRRSAATDLNNFATTSNNNLLFGGTPSATRLIFYDGTNSDQTIAAYKTRVSTRETNSVSELPTWQSTTGSNANFLKYSNALASLADGAAGTGTGITDDYAGTTRDATTPDMGAWEIDLIPILTIADNGTQPTAANINQGSTNNILQSFTVVEGNRANATLNTVTIPLAGTYVAADIQASGLKLWRNTSNSFAGATAFTGITATGSGETATFSSLAFGITKNTTVYFWVTADILPTATAGNTINANALAPANFTFALGTPTGTVSAGGAQTIVAPPTYYLKAGGVSTTLTDWGTNTDGTGANPSAFNQAEVFWHIRNNTTVTNSASWTLGLNARIIVGDGVGATNFIVPTSASIIGIIDVNNLGTLTLQDASNPTFGVLSVGSTVDYNGTSAQTVAIATYSNLTISGTRTGSPVITLASGTIDVSGNFSVTATGVGSYTNTGNTVNFSSASMQTIPALAYRNITNTGNGNRTLASSGEVNIAGTFALGTGAYTVTGSTVNYSATSGGGFIMASFNYNNLIFSGTQTFSIGTGNTMNVAGDFTLSASTFNVSNAGGTSTLAVTGNANISGGTMSISNSTGTGVFSVGTDINLSGGLFRVISNASAPSTTVNITRDLNVSGAGRIDLETTSSVTGVANINVGRDFISTGTTAGGSNGVVDFGTGIVANNAINIARNFSHTTSGTFGTESTNAPLGFNFNGGGALQTFSYTGAASSQFTPYALGVNSQLQMLSNLALPLGTNPRSNFTVNTGAILDMGTRVISTNNTTDAIFTLPSGATIKTAHASGLTANFSGFTAGTTLLLNSGANYEFNGSVAQVTSAFVTTPTANTVNNLTINNSAGVTLTNDLTATNTLTMTAGAIDANVNNRTLTLGTSAVSTGTLNYTSGVIVGKFKRWIAASATSYDFPIGISMQVRNANITYTGASSGGSLTAQHIIGEAGTSGLPLTEGAIAVTNVAKAVWQINAGDGLVGGTYTATMNATGLSGITDFAKLVMLKRANNASAWTLEGTHVTTAGSNGLPILQRTGLTGFSEFGVGGGFGNPLPITLANFKANRAVDGQSNRLTEEVKLEWITANEVNNKGFEVEMSENGLTYKKIAFVESLGNSTTIQTYSHTFTNPNDAYYRLKQVDFDGTFSYSPVVFVEGIETLKVYPNPNKGNFTILSGKATLDLPARLLNAQGKEVWHGVQTEVRTTALPSGVYFLHTVRAGKINVQKVVIE